MQSEDVKLSRLMGFGSDPSDNTISVALANEENCGFQINLELSVIPSLMAAITAEAIKLQEANGVEITDIAKTLYANAVFMSVSAEGNPTIVFELANGLKLPLELRGGDLAGLASEMALLAHRPDGNAN